MGTRRLKKKKKKFTSFRLPKIIDQKWADRPTIKITSYFYRISQLGLFQSSWRVILYPERTQLKCSSQEIFFTQRSKMESTKFWPFQTLPIVHYWLQRYTKIRIFFFQESALSFLFFDVEDQILLPSVNCYNTNT